LQPSVVALGHWEELGKNNSKGLAMDGNTSGGPAARKGLTGQAMQACATIRKEGEKTAQPPFVGSIPTGAS